MKTDTVFAHSFGFKRYHTQDYYLKKIFGQKVFKVPVNGGFTCPNRDGTKGVGGCTYCSEKGSGDFAGDATVSIEEQFHQIKAKLHTKWPDAAYIVYFQAFTNTYGSIQRVRRMLESAAALEGVVGLSVSTRPDCIDEEMADLLKEFADRVYLEVELGLQSIHPQTILRINRCHSLEEFEQGYRLLEERGIFTCIHIINGLPGESREMMLDTARYVGSLHPHSVKIHMLHLIKGSRMTAEWQQSPFPLLELEEYVAMVCDQLELLPPDTVIQRVTGDGDRTSLVAPLWTMKKLVVINNIDKELLRRNSFQGKRFPVKASSADAAKQEEQ